MSPSDETGPGLRIHPVPPFRLDLTVWALRRVSTNEMDLWDGAVYRRVLSLDQTAVEVTVTQSGGADQPELWVSVEPDDIMPSLVRRQLTSLLGLETDLFPFYRVAAGYGPLDLLARRFRGLKPPRFPTVFEALVNGIACQQLSLNVGIAVLNRLCDAFGLVGGQGHAFPGPAELAIADPRALRSLGFSIRKAEHIVGLARAVESGQVDLERLADLDDSAAVEELDLLPGVGRWTAQYAALRGLGRLDVFPADDVGSQNKIQQWLSLEKRPGYDEVNRLIAAFQPYRGLIYFHLLLNYLAERGHVQPAPGEA